VNSLLAALPTARPCGETKQDLSEIEAGRERIPPRYREATQLGAEIAVDSTEIHSSFSVKLSSR